MILKPGGGELPMSRKSDSEFWASRMRTRFRIYNALTGERCEVSAGSYYEALANLGWRKDDCFGINLGKMQQLPKPNWYVRHAKISDKDVENE